MHEHPWGFLIVLYLFLGGLGAGCLALSGLAWLSRRAELERVGRVGALIAPLPVAFGSLLLIFDLGSPWRFWRLFAHFNPVSPMSIGSWLLLLFTAVAAVWAALQLPAAWIDSVQRRLGRRGAWLAPLRRRNASPAANARVRDAVALAGVLLGLGVGIYTGVLLGAIPARPFWNTPIVAQLFLFSAFSTATALLALAAPLFPALRSSGEGPERRALLRADVAFIVLELFILIPFVVHGELSVLSARASLDMILGGPTPRCSGAVWWDWESCCPSRWSRPSCSASPGACRARPNAGSRSSPRSWCWSAAGWCAGSSSTPARRRRFSSVVSFAANRRLDDLAENRT